MKYQITYTRSEQQLHINCDETIDKRLLDEIEKIKGVASCWIERRDKYRITLTKGYLFDWKQLEIDIRRVMDK